MSTIVYNFYSVEAPGTRLDNHIHNVIAYSTNRIILICLHSRDIVVTTGTPHPWPGYQTPRRGKGTHKVHINHTNIESHHGRAIALANISTSRTANEIPTPPLRSKCRIKGRRTISLYCELLEFRIKATIRLYYVRLLGLNNTR